MSMICHPKDRNLFIIGVCLLIFCLAGAGCLSPDTDKAPAEELIIEGEGVKGEKVFTLSDLQLMEEGLVEADYFGINTYGAKGHTHFKGIGVWYLLSKQAELKDDAAYVTFIAEDGYEVTYSLAEVEKGDYIDEQNPEAKLKMILAWEENGYEYDPRVGMPLQLTVGQQEPGDINKPYWVKNVVTIRVER